MTISRVKPAGWALNEKLTSAQQNAVDTNVTYALDKRSGQTDTLSSTIVVDSDADITYQSGSAVTHEADSNETYSADSALYLHGLTDFDGFSSHNNGDVVNYYSGSSINHLSGSAEHYTSGAMMINDGYGEFADLRLSGTSKVNYKTPRSFTRHFSPALDRNMTFGDGTTNFIPTVIINPVSIVACACLDLGQCGIPNGATLTGVSCSFTPPSGHLFLPEAQPILKLVRRSLVFGYTESIVFNTFSLSLNLADYEQFTTLSPVGLSHTLDFATYQYMVIFRTENGTNSLTGMKVFPISVSFTTSNMNDY